MTSASVHRLQSSGDTTDFESQPASQPSREKPAGYTSKTAPPSTVTSASASQSSTDATDFESQQSSQPARASTPLVLPTQAHEVFYVITIKLKLCTLYF